MPDHFRNGDIEALSRYLARVSWVRLEGPGSVLDEFSCPAAPVSETGVGARSGALMKRREPHLHLVGDGLRFSGPWRLGSPRPEHRQVPRLGRAHFLVLAW